PRSTPAQGRCNLRDDRLHHVRREVDAQLIGNSDQQRVRLRDALVIAQLLDETIGFIRVRATEDRAGALVDVADLVLAVVPTEEVPAVLVARDRDDRARDRRTRLEAPLLGVPRLFEGTQLFRVLDVEGLARLIVLQCRAHEVHARLGRPYRGRVRAGAPPDALAQALARGLESKEAGRVGEHAARVRLSEALPLEELQEELGLLASCV